MTKKEIESVNTQLRELTDKAFDLAHAHGIRLHLKIRWPDGLKVEQRSLNARELAANAKRDARQKKEGE